MCWWYTSRTIRSDRKMKYVVLVVLFTCCDFLGVAVAVAATIVAAARFFYFLCHQSKTLLISIHRSPCQYRPNFISRKTKQLPCLNRRSRKQKSPNITFHFTPESRISHREICLYLHLEFFFFFFSFLNEVFCF